jgi:hypothetical protein
MEVSACHGGGTGAGWGNVTNNLSGGQLIAANVNIGISVGVPFFGVLTVRGATPISTTTASSMATITR